ncbi:nitroreductase/quinone reductase family protein [Gordonia sp. VNK21]|uniref:nitroreductase/quinone reductase family protein n=1 Tax=Gordonia sp. VNK21 TaxID=3382483 RepID=UPI0038D4D500
MGLLTPIAVRVGAIPWLPQHLPAIVKVDETLQKLTGERVDILRVAGLPSVTMIIPGRKSGVERSTTVLAVPDGDDWLVAGSYFGGPKTPAWVYNLRAVPAIEVITRGDHRIRMSRTEIAEPERASTWPAMDRVWPNFALYRKRTDRTIPIFRLSPQDG